MIGSPLALALCLQLSGIPQSPQTVPHRTINKSDSQYRPIFDAFEIEWIGPRFSEAKVRLRYVSSADISAGFGGGIFDPRGPGARGPLPNPTILGAVDGPLQSLLPEGIDSLVGYPVDNSLIIRGTSEAIGELLEMIRPLDLPPISVSVKISINLSVETRKGRRRVLHSNTVALVSSDRKARTMIVGNGPITSSKGFILEAAEVDTDMTLLRTSGDRIPIHSDWSVELVWRSGPKSPPVRFESLFRSSVAPRSGQTASVYATTLNLPQGTALLSMELTPTIVPSRTSPPKSKAR